MRTYSSGVRTFFDGLSHVLMVFGLVETRSKKDGPVRTTGSSHARAESRFASQVHMHLQDDINWENSVAIQSAEYGLGRLCCSYDMLHAFNLIVVGTVFPSTIRLLHAHTMS